jgi:hypothetical protein
VISLTDAERETFAAYLDQEAAQSKRLVAQLERLPAPELGATIAKKYKAEALAMRVVSAWLRAWESDRISGEAQP